ncbi:MAG: helix-turn-helix transcriptional regulator [Oscillospiraceae bacterium]|nr:helix-turn-helix transcriptional regulator [Oscillospiraceae bacterium]
MTQERWAEAIGCSVRSIRDYETGVQIPPDDIVLSMCEISGHVAVAYWHMRNKSPLAAEVLPEVEQLPLPQAAVQLLLAVEDFSGVHGDLLRLAADGRISSDEAQDWAGIIRRLDGIVQAAIQLKVAEGGGGA